MKRLLFILLLIPSFAFAQISQQTITNDITNNLPTNNRNEISAELLRNTLNAMTSAIFQSQGLNGLTVTGTPTIGQVPVATSSTTASWQSIGGQVTSVSNSDGSLLFSPNTLNVIGSITAHANTWSALQNFNTGLSANALAINGTNCPTSAPGIRGPLLVCNDLPGTSSAGQNGVAQFWMSNSLTGTPGANEAVAVTAYAANGNNRGFIGTMNLVANQCGPSSNAACSVANGFLDNLLVGLEIDVNTDASYSTANRAFNRTTGTYAKNGIELYSLGSSGTGNGPTTAAASIWCSDATITTCWHEGVVISRTSDIGLHFVANPTGTDTGTVFGVAAIYDESNSGISILETGTHTSIIDVSGATYTNTINCGSLACKFAGTSFDVNGGPLTFNGINTLNRNGVDGHVTLNSNASNIVFTPAGTTVLTLASTGPSLQVIPTSAGGGGLFLCIDTAGVIYKKATCP